MDLSKAEKHHLLQHPCQCGVYESGKTCLRHLQSLNRGRYGFADDDAEEDLYFKI